MNYYNEHDPKAAAWLRELIAERLIPAGEVDTRSITEVKSHELRSFVQCHFFAGIAGWPLALQLAGWPESRPVWTGSCPCQPFSAAGKGEGAGDDRHLWPVFRWLIAQQRPKRVFGEQVAQAIGFNWLDGVSADLEADGYTVGAAVLGAHSVGAPHIRQRLYWVADAHGGRCQQRNQDERAVPISAADGPAGGLDDPAGPRLVGSGQRESLREQRGGECLPGAGRDVVRVGESFQSRLFGLAGHGDRGDQPGRIDAGEARYAAPAGPWSGGGVVHCRDGKTRRIPAESALFPLADGLPGRVGLLRGAGNAIVPQTAAEFVMACCEVLDAVPS